MLQVSEVSKSYGSQVLLDGISFTVNLGERIGLVGRNGHGKSTLFRLILGEEQPDSGTLSVSNGYRIGHLSQHLKFTEDSVLREAALALPQNEDGWEETYKAEKVLSGLGFDEQSSLIHPNKLSGGYQIRLNLAKLLISEPHLLLLDEPTNYLDIVSMRWLMSFLRDWKHELMLITHERAFMDAVTTHTMAIHRTKIRKMAGSTGKVYEQISLEEEIHEQTRQNQEEKIKKTEEFIRRFRAKATKATAVQSRIKALDRMEKLERLTEIETLDFGFRHAPFTGKWPLTVTDLTFGYQKSKPLIENLSFQLSKKDRIAVIGKNGKGKTTLLRLLAEELKPLEGEVRFSPHTRLSYFGQTNVERLDSQKTVEEEVLAVHPEHNRTAARTICGQMMFSGDSALKKVKHLSGGEKSRVLLGKILVSPSNLLLLDEPTNHLDMHSSAAFMDAIERFPGAVIMVTHSEEMVKRVANRLIVFDGGKITVFDGGYRDFVRKVGWADEGGVREESTSEGTAFSSKLDKKEQRRIKAEVNRLRSEESKPVRNRLSKIESEIVRLEESVEQDTEELVEISKNGFGDTAAKLSRTIHENKQKIEELFEELDQGSKTLEEIEARYNQMLEEKLT